MLFKPRAGAFLFLPSFYTFPEHCNAMLPGVDGSKRRMAMAGTNAAFGNLAHLLESHASFHFNSLRFSFFSASQLGILFVMFIWMLIHLLCPVFPFFVRLLVDVLALISCFVLFVLTPANYLITEFASASVLMNALRLAHWRQSLNEWFSSFFFAWLIGFSGFGCQLKKKRKLNKKRRNYEKLCIKVKWAVPR